MSAQETNAADPARPDLLHVGMGALLTVILVCATPALLWIGTLAAGTLGSFLPLGQSWFAALSTAGPMLLVYLWLAGMGVGQLVIVIPTAGLALARGRRHCAAGMGLGALLVLLANVLSLAILIFTAPQLLPNLLATTGLSP